MSSKLYSPKFKDRRIKIVQTFPLMDDGGEVIESERRCGVPDHRYGGIELSKINISQKEFEKYFNDIKI